MMLEGTGISVNNPTATAETGQRLVWVKKGNELLPKSVTVGSNNNTETEVVAGLNEGEEIAVDLVSLAPSAPAAQGGERSPFMPGPPGGNKNKK